MINWNDINLRNRSNGNLKTLCPACSHNRKNKKDRCLSVSIGQGLAKCWNCDEVSVRDSKKEDDYKLPNQQWTNYTKISDELVNWFKGNRNISQQTIIDCKITEEKYWQPTLSKNVKNIVFNYFEGNVLVNKKYRSSDKKFTQTAGTKKVLYGLNDIIGCDEIYIVEGELDKLSFWEAGYKNCVSVPNGAKDLTNYFETCEAYLKNLKKVFIAVDTDSDGKNLERELVKRFGKWRCARIEFDGEKDANDLLKIGILKLQNAIKSPKYYPVDGTFTANDIKDDLLDYYENGIEECPAPKSSNYAKLNKVFKIMMGQLTVVTGIPSHGKSNFIEDYVINLINDYNFKASFYSPEHFPMKLHHGVLAEKVIGKPFDRDFSDNPRMTKDDLDNYIKWSKDKIYITYPEKGETVNWKWLLDKFREQLFRFGIDIFVIDAFNKVKRENPDSLGEINNVLSDLCQFAQANNVHVFLIAHPVKMQKDNKTGLYAAPTLYDVKGSGDFRDQAHNGLCVYRYFDRDSEEGHTEVINLKTKFKNQGVITGSADFKYDFTNGRYYDKNGMPDRVVLFDQNRKEAQGTEKFKYEDLPF